MAIIENTQYSEGEYLIVTSGSYSDYVIEGLFKVLKDFNALDFKSGKKTGFYEPMIDLIRLLKEGYLNEIPNRELWLGH